MNYNDEQLLSINDYAKMAKAYSENSKSTKSIFIKIDNEKNSILINEMFETISTIKSCLFFMGGFLNTSSFYSLNEKQSKYLKSIFDFNFHKQKSFYSKDKTKCFLLFISCEAKLIKIMLELCQYTNYYNELNEIINNRLSLFQEIFQNFVL